MKENKSKWFDVTEMMEGSKDIELGNYNSFWFYKTPRRVLHSLSYYKFAAKMIGNKKRVLDIGCNEGLGSFLISKECGFVKGIDFDEEAIKAANKNFAGPDVEFEKIDFFKYSNKVKWDAIVTFDVIEHIIPENSDKFFRAVIDNLNHHGIFILGTPSEISQKFANEVSKKGHVNIYSHTRLEEQMKKYFDFVFMFSANDEIVHTGFLPLAHYFITIGCRIKNN